jgi:hypothetical protein
MTVRSVRDVKEKSAAFLPERKVSLTRRREDTKGPDVTMLSFAVFAPSRE